MSASPALAPDPSTTSTDDRFRWQPLVAPFRKSDTRHSVFQLVSTWGLFFALWAAAYLALDISIALTLAIDVVLGGVTVRLFIIQHDCGHGSFFATERANRLAGLLPSVLLLPPYAAWRQDHAIHHATTGDLDRRGHGDVPTMTLEEFRAAPWWQRLGYRIFRNPIVMLGIGPFFVFVIGHRFPGVFGGEKTRAFRVAVHLTTLASFSVWALIIALFGWRGFFLVHLPALYLAAASGVFLFYVQHQFATVYWRRSAEWSYLDACLEGCSHLELNPVLAWFSGNIGVHHIHHLAPKIPNYKLRACLDTHPELAAKTTLTLWQAFSTFRFKLYDEAGRRMVGFSSAPPVVSARP